MTGWLYLIRNKDLYKIGITRNLDRRMIQLKPDKIIAKLYTRDFLKLEKELHYRYKKFRIPQTEYFRLEDNHLKEINQRLSNLDYPISMLIGIFTKSLLSILLVFFLLIIFVSLNINDTNIIILESVFWMEKITFVYSFLSMFLHSGRYLSFLGELKFRCSRFFIFIIFSFLFRFTYIFL